MGDGGPPGARRGRLQLRLGPRRHPAGRSRGRPGAVPVPGGGTRGLARLGTARNSTARLGTGGMALGFNLSALPPLREYEVERSFDEREALGWMRDNWWVSARRRGSSCWESRSAPCLPSMCHCSPRGKGDGSEQPPRHHRAALV